MTYCFYFYYNIEYWSKNVIFSIIFLIVMEHSRLLVQDVPTSILKVCGGKMFNDASWTIWRHTALSCGSDGKLENLNFLQHNSVIATENLYVSTQGNEQLQSGTIMETAGRWEADGSNNVMSVIVIKLKLLLQPECTNVKFCIVDQRFVSLNIFQTVSCFLNRFLLELKTSWLCTSRLVL